MINTILKYLIQFLFFLITRFHKNSAFHIHTTTGSTQLNYSAKHFTRVKYFPLCDSDKSLYGAKLLITIFISEI